MARVKNRRKSIQLAADHGARMAAWSPDTRDAYEAIHDTMRAHDVATVDGTRYTVRRPSAIGMTATASIYDPILGTTIVGSATVVR